MPAGAPPVPAGPRAIVGREPELRRVEGFLDAVAAGPVALVVEGEVGIGKTALWRHGLEAAAGRSYRVLSCRPIDTEAQLAYTALGDLLVEVPDAILGELPGPQRHALEVALLRAEPEERQSLPRAVALGLLGVLRALARGGPTLVAVDDVQWLDQPSRSALAFVARRLTDERVGLLVARRLEGEPGVPLDLDRALPAGRLHRLEVGSLAVAELDRLLAARLPTPLPRRTLLRLHRVSGGNPFFAQEIALAILRNGAQDAPTEELPVPASLQGLLHDRLALLAPPALEAVQTVAALSRPTVALVDRLREAARRSRRRPPPASWSSTPSRCGSRTRCSRRSPWRSCPRRGGGSCTGAWPRSSTTRRNAGGTWHWRRRAPTPRSRPRSTTPPAGRAPAARPTRPPCCGSRHAG
jgi:AAA ATPase domain